MLDKTFLVLAILGVISIGARGKPIKERSSYLWRIDSLPPSYLFGTIHVPYTLVWDSVSEDAKRAFNSANQVYLELDLSDKEAQLVESCQLLPQGQNISQVRF